MREHEIKMILNWIGAGDGTRLITEAMLRQAIDYAYRMGYTDGSQ